MALKSRDLPTKCWQIVLPDALHSIRSLLSTATNVTPHERLFNFARRSTTGGSLPTWLCMPGPVLLKRHVRHSKAEPLVDQVELLQANPTTDNCYFWRAAIILLSENGQSTLFRISVISACYN